MLDFLLLTCVHWPELGILQSTLKRFKYDSLVDWIQMTEDRQNGQSTILGCFLCVGGWGRGRFSFFFCGKTEIMRKQPRSSLLINFPFLSSFPECYQSSHLHNQQVIAFSIANNSLLVSVLYLICKLLPWQHFFFFRGKPNTTDIYRSNLNNVSRGNWYFPSKLGNTLELTKH